MNIVLFDENEIGNPLPLADTRTVHIRKILHKDVGDTFDAGIVGGMAGRAKITAIDENGLNFEFTPLTDGKRLYPLTMIIGFPRPIQLKRLFRDMAGLGVERILLCGTELGEKSYMQGDIAQPEKARELLKEGSVQAASTHVPEIEVFPSLKACLESLEDDCAEGIGADFVVDKGNGAGGNETRKMRSCAGGGNTGQVARVALDNVHPAMSLGKFLAEKDLSGQTIVAAIGSERGWTDSERALFEKSGFVLCSMGNRVLRTETASTVAASIILNEMGVLK